MKSAAKVNVEVVSRAYMQVPSHRRDEMLVRGLLEIVIADAKRVRLGLPVAPFAVEGGGA